MLFGILGILILYTVVLYPGIVILAAHLVKRRYPISQKLETWPTVSLVIPIFNEEKILGQKLNNCLSINYPGDQIEFLFASDGSTDGSIDILNACGDPRVRVLNFPKNRGKMAVLNDAIEVASGELILLTDASGMLERESLKAIALRFLDEDVGVVCGFYRVRREGRSQVDSAEHTYHGFEMELRWAEGELWSTLSGTGALCCIRRECFVPLPVELINDDFVIPACVALRGRRVVYERGAVVEDVIHTNFRSAFRRRARIAYGNWQQLQVLRELLNPARGYLFLVFVSHKIMRMALPVLLIMFALCLSWSFQWMRMLIVMSILGVLVIGGVGLLVDRYLKGYNPFGVAGLYLLNCAAMVVGSIRYFTGRGVRW